MHFKDRYPKHQLVAKWTVFEQWNQQNLMIHEVDYFNNDQTHSPDLDALKYV